MGHGASSVGYSHVGANTIVTFASHTPNKTRTLNIANGKSVLLSFPLNVSQNYLEYILVRLLNQTAKLMSCVLTLKPATTGNNLQI